MSDTPKKVLVPADALFQVLTALTGPPHLIRELMVLSIPILFPDNPIGQLINAYNDWDEQQKEAPDA